MFLTPPQTPIFIGYNNANNNIGYNDDIDLEILAVNFSFETTKPEKKCNEYEVAIRKDIMWSNNNELFIRECNDTTGSCNEKRLRRRALVTPLIFSSAVKFNEPTESEEDEEKGDFLAKEYSDILLSPAETENSDDEIDVVGGVDDLSASTRILTTNAHVNITPNISVYHPACHLETFKITTTTTATSEKNGVYINEIQNKAKTTLQNETEQRKSTSSKNCTKRKQLSLILDQQTSNVSQVLSTPAGDDTITRLLPKSHNSSEKKRRDILKTKFVDLKRCIPDLHDYDKAPKIAILNKASELINELYVTEQRLNDELKIQRNFNATLSKKLHHLNQNRQFIYPIKLL